jgi:putative ABC transport system permease protein
MNELPMIGLRNAWRKMKRTERREVADPDVAREIDEELSFHLDMRTRESIEAGMSPEEARRRAIERLGEIERVRRSGHIIRTRGRRADSVACLAGDLRRDLRFARRSMMGAPGFTAVAVIALTLGIGATTAVFSVVDGVLLEALPYPEPDRLVMVVGMGVRSETSDALRGLDTLTGAAFFGIGASEMEGPAGATRGRVMRVDEHFFGVLGLGLARGRALVADDFRPDAQRVAVITDRLWRDFLGGDDNALGSTLLLNGMPYEVVGVLPPGVTMLVYEDYDIFTPLAGREPGGMMLGRLRTGVSFEQGREEALALAATFGLDDEVAQLDRLAEASDGQVIYYRTLYEQVVGGDRDGLLLLAGAVSLVLLIAAANVANLSLARALSRRGEIAVRSALGAGRGRLIRQLLTENALLSLAGGTLGVLLAVRGVPALLALRPAYMSRADNIAVDLRVLGFTVVVSLLVGVAGGLVPVAFAGRTEPGRAMAGGTTRAGEPRTAQRALTALVIGEVALALVVLVATGLLVRAFLDIRPSSPGFDPAGKLVFELRLPESRYPDPQARALAYEGILAGLRALPDAEGAAAVTAPPLVGMVWPVSAVPEGMDTTGDSLPTVWLEFASASYHEVMDIALLRGRALRSPAEGAPEIVLSETAARALFPDSDPLGKRVSLQLPQGTLGEYVADHRVDDQHVVVGIAADTRRLAGSRQPRPTVWIDFLSGGSPRMTFVVQARGRPEDLAGPVRERVAEIDPRMPIGDLRTMDDVVYQSANNPRFYMTLMGVFGSIAVLLAVIGFYGLMAFSVGRRTRELGVRVALGASPSAIRRLVLRQGGGIVGAGIALGLAGCFAVSRLLESFLYGLSPTDPLTYASLTTLIAAIGLIASYVPAWRATRVDPLIALREQ